VDDTQKLVHRILAGDNDAWRDLQTRVEPTILGIARRHRGLRRKGLAQLPDDVAEVRTASLERLAQDDFRNLRNFVERGADADRGSPQSFDAWLYGLVDYVIRDHIRSRYGRAPKLPGEQAGRAQPSKRDLQSHAGRLDDEPERNFLSVVSVTTKLTIGEIFAYIATAFTAQEAQAVRLYFGEGQSYEEIARALQLDNAKLAEQLIRRLNARLRYRFLTPEGGASKA
jgi:DNA-directed RNA polymerase specialized sigma24 family protein